MSPLPPLASERATLERQIAHLEKALVLEEARLEAIRPHGVRRRGLLPGIFVGFLLVGLFAAGAMFMAFGAIMSMD